MFSPLIPTLMTAIIMLPSFVAGQGQTQTAAVSREQSKTVQEEPRSDAQRVVTVVLPDGAVLATVPEGENAWVVQLVVGGGIAGMPSSITITSTGTVTCNGETRVRGNILAAKLQEISQLVASVSVAAAVPFDRLSQRSQASLCSDCTRTTLMMSRREANHKIRTYSTTWDAVTRSSLSEDLARVYDSITKMNACQQ